MALSAHLLLNFHGVPLLFTVIASKHKSSITMSSLLLRLILLACTVSSTVAFLPSPQTAQRSPRASLLKMTADNDEASRLQKKAEELREQIRNMEASLGDDRRRPAQQPPTQPQVALDEKGMSLVGKRVLVVGANGRLGSMVCRYLLRNNSKTQVVAAVHVVGENSSTSRGYGRLSYEVGAEDGVGSIGPAWSSEDRTATFTYSDEMKDYNLQNLRVVEVELLDPLQCATITEGVDSVIWCATDFNGNKPRAVSGLNVAFLFRAVADPLKGRVEIEGLRNILGGLKQNKRDASGALDAVLGKTSSTSSSSSNDPVDFILVSAAPDAYKDFETPFGTFNGLKREGEELLKNEFPSLSYSILQMSKYEDNFVEESLDIMTDETGNAEDAVRRRINRRDAARAAVEALTNDDGKDKTLQVWTALRG